ncbi:transmembrane protein 42-like protein [Radiomyces spectabilis]|uniref:transmembrane protein 42-like protein n=1 Tax=Radiomyces spectabilis TaxID=64574 RepID=UPI00221FA860|nr:transmembrane protein 42-like protein [Radiomyces spectabilis]KAI8376353.1 transmembrane protein 42-like protein [Radiomyces spectabilis]
MWTLFTKALNMAPSSVQVSVINGAANLSASALLGYLVFDEPLTLRWWCGASLILAGTILLSRSQKEKTE